MRYTKLGHSGIEVSALCLGCMSFGEAGTMHDWTVDAAATDDIVGEALDAGINFFDTANCYSAGTSEEYLGRALKNHTTRDKVIIASKVYFNEGRLSKAAIEREIEGTLRRLGTDYLDLYIIHRFDYETPILETMQALDALVRAGKVRAIGASAMYGHQFYEMQIAARDNNLTLFTAMEDHYNLLFREDERDLIPVCEKFGVARMPYSPLAGGHLTRPDWNYDSKRRQTDKVLRGKYDRMEEYDIKIVKRVAEIAAKQGCLMSQVALAWQWARGVVSPIIGATKAKYIADAVGALDVTLSPEEVEYLEELYVPHPMTGAIKQNPPQGVILLDKKD